MDGQGNFYGTNLYGGPKNQGVVLEVAPDGAETVLHSFDENRGDAYSRATLIHDKAAISTARRRSVTLPTSRPSLKSSDKGNLLHD